MALAAAAVVLAGIDFYCQTLKPTPYDLRVLGQTAWLPGSNAALHLRVLRHDGEPERGVPVACRVGRPSHARGPSRATGQPEDRRAMARPWRRFDCPTGPMARISCGSPPARRGRQPRDISRSVTIQHSWRLMASTDKPVYQPGQMIHMRGLALRRPDLKPVAGQTMTFSLTDPRGNVVFRDAKADQPVRHRLGRLPDRRRGNRGQLPGRLPRRRYDGRDDGRGPAIRPAAVQGRDLARSAVLPAGPDRSRGASQADYVFGKPVTDGAVTVALETSTVRAERRYRRSSSAPTPRASAAFALALPDTLVGREQDGGAGTGRRSRRPSATPPARRRAEPRTGSWRRSPIRIEVIPESGVAGQGPAQHDPPAHHHASTAGRSGRESTISGLDSRR